MGLARKIIDFLTGRPSARKVRFDYSTSITPGDTVVCVGGGRWTTAVSRDGVVEPFHGIGPVEGLTYSVVDVVAFECGAIGLKLRECPGVLWAARHFKKVRTTSIDCFKSLLNPSPEEVLAGTAGGNDYDVPTPAKREVAATTSLFGVSPLPDDLLHERACQLAKRDHRIPPAAFSQRPNLAPDLPFLVDGRVPLSHSLQSPMPSSSPMFAVNHGDDGHGIH